ncbi:hypothetical protein RM780_18670, partial [Streptomyces sp. DSM 44917]|nr:hypothetical protein [Streptomyces sp. DSM 44917]
MARGRHRSAALHRVLLPASLAGTALAGAAVLWMPVDWEATVARGVVSAVALATLTGALLMRRWDREAARQVARERAAKSGLSWQLEERQAELEDSQELIAALEAKVRDKRAELGRLRTEHAALLRRYATAETERAKALEGRRLLALEAAEPAKQLSAQAADHRTAGGAPTALTYRQAAEALSRLSRNAARQREARDEARDAELRRRREAPQPGPSTP